MPVRGLGSRDAKGTSDSGVNQNPFLRGTGWNVLFTPEILSCAETEFEVYQIAVDGPIGSSFQVSLEGHNWNFVNQGWKNAYDPSQPLLVAAGQTVQFFWNTAFAAGPYNQTTNIQPVATVWLRRVGELI